MLHPLNVVTFSNVLAAPHSEILQKKYSENSESASNTADFFDNSLSLNKVHFNYPSKPSGHTAPASTSSSSIYKCLYTFLPPSYICGPIDKVFAAALRAISFSCSTFSTVCHSFSSNESRSSFSSESRLSWCCVVFLPLFFSSKCVHSAFLLEEYIHARH